MPSASGPDAALRLRAGAAGGPDHSPLTASWTTATSLTKPYWDPCIHGVTPRPHRALDERTPRAAHLAAEHCGQRAAFGGPAT